MIDPQLDGKVAIVTGANHGIGAAIARKLAAQGVKVLIHYYRVPSQFSAADMAEALARQEKGGTLYRALQQQSAEIIVDEIRASGGHAIGWEADLGDGNNVSRMFNQCEAVFGSCEIMVANHTHCVPQTFDPARVEGGKAGGLGVSLVDSAEIDRHFQINTRAVALMMREYIERHAARGATWGRIINISTDAAARHDDNVSYAASKYAIESYTQSAAGELGHYGLTVNVVSPGPTQTGYMTQELEDQVAQRIPLRRVGRPDDVADVVVFVASEQGRWLTGQVIYAGGGWKMPL